jgi:hypothetical protein
MKRSSILFLQGLIILIAISTIVLMLWEPQIEGRNVNATFSQVYFNDPFLVYAYIASIPFFIALYKAFKVLGYAGQNKFLSQPVVKALQTIKYCGMAMFAFTAGGEIIIMSNTSDDRAGGVFMGILIALVSIAITTVAGKLGRALQNAIAIESKDHVVA